MSPKRSGDPLDPAVALESDLELIGDRATAVQDFSSEEAGYHKSLKPRQIQMIAMGGAIGTGLFLGAGGRLETSGPALVLVYTICGFFAFIILRALGELVLHRPSSGSFVSYAREFYGEKLAFTAGWLYFVNWATTAIVDVTAAALYVKFWAQYWEPLQTVPQWLIALVALIAVLGLNLVSVKLFGEMEFWFALIKVLAIVAFMLVGILFLIFGGATDAGATGFGMVSDNGGWLPTGIVAPVLASAGVIFAYAAIELVGTAAGETANPEKVMPKAINAVVFRIAVFYVGTVLLLSLLLPYTVYEAGVSPFVTFFSNIGSPEAGTIAGSVMNFVVLTAALSSLNAGLYSTGRILRSMSVNGSAPSFARVMNRGGVPYGGILLTVGVTLIGIVINALWPSRAFEIVLEISALGIIFGWATIIACHLKFVSRAKQGRVSRPGFQLFAAPYTNWITLVFLAFVVVSLGFSETGRWVLASLVVLVPMFIIGWFAARKSVYRAAAEREGYTGTVSVLPERPALQRKDRQP